jgi:hypothetical protein
MTTRTGKSGKKIKKSGVKTKATKTLKNVTIVPRELSGQALLDDMAAYRKKISASPEAARDFLVRLGVMDPEGNLKTLTHG